MPNKDRGIIKWQPFAALKEYDEAIKKLLENKNKIEKPLLSEDTLELLDEAFNEALMNNTLVKIKIYQNGSFFDIEGKITKVDKIYKTILIEGNNKKIYLADIVEFYLMK